MHTSIYWGLPSGLFVCFFELIRDYAYYKFPNQKNIYYLSIPICIFFAWKTYVNVYDILPLVACLIDGYILTKDKETINKGAIVEYILLLIYDISVLSYSCAITNGLLIVSNIAILLSNNEIISEYIKDIYRQIMSLF